MSDKTFSVESLLTDETFINYCFKSNLEDISYWQKKIDNDPELADLKQQAFELLALISNSDISEVEIESGLAAFTGHMEKEKIHRSNRIWFSLMSYAAALLMVLGIGWYFGKRSTISNTLAQKQQPVEIFNRKGQRMVIKLPDSSVVTLNGGSWIKYDAFAFSGKSRDLELEGEAFFEVKKNVNRPFTVKCGQLKVRVLGTSFNVNAYPEQKKLRIALVTGSVLVNNLQNQKIQQLKPLQMLSYDKKTTSHHTSIFDPLELTGWKEGHLVFKGADFNEIRDKLELMYNMKLINKSTTQLWSFYAEFKNEPIQNIIKALTRSKSLTYESRDSTITIRDYQP